MTVSPETDHATRDFLKALASDARQAILRLFIGGVELSVGEIAEQVAISPSTASEHLSLMRRAGLLLSRREGKVVRYRVDSTRIGTQLNELKAYLNCCSPPRR